MTEAVTKQETKGLTIRKLIEGDAFRGQVSKALPRHLTPDRFIRVALTALTRTPKLMQCTQESLFKCLLDCSAFGLEPDGRRAHLIPYGDQATLIVDYKGIAELAMRSGVISNLHADVVCENDVFEYDKGFVTEHKIDFKKPRGNVYAAYSICRFKDGTEKAEVMTKDEIEDIRKRSKAGKSGPWVTDWNEMAKKTVFRRLSKWLPLSSELRDAAENDDDKLDDPPSGVWVPPEAEKPIFREPPAKTVTEPEPEPTNDQPQETEPEPEQPTSSEPDNGITPKEELLIRWTEDLGGTEMQLVSVLRDKKLIKINEDMDNVTETQSADLLKDIKELWERHEELKGNKR